MRTFITLCLTLLSFNVAAQSDYAITWNMDSFQFGGVTGDQLLLDLNLGTRFVSANGVIDFSDGSSVGTTGTCYSTADASVVCNLTLDFLTVAFEVDLDTLNGSGLLIDYDGFVLDSGTLELVSIE